MGNDHDDEENPTPEDPTSPKTANGNASEKDGVDNDNNDNNNDKDGDNPSIRNINSYYGHKIGFLQTLSLTLNAGLMVYAHLGLSAVILSSQDPSVTSATTASNNNNIMNTDIADADAGNAVENNNGAPTNTSSVTAQEGKCNSQDLELWFEYEGEATRAEHSNYCSRKYNENGCLVDSGCIETCIQETYGYSEECSSCFGVVPLCSVSNGCLFACGTDSFSPECEECNIPCVEEFGVCTGLPVVDENGTGTALLPTNNETDNDATAPLPPNSAITDGNACNNFDLEAIDTWYNVYDLTFVKSINDAWNGDAKLLAVIIVVFSGIWPYLKNIILVIIWYLPTTVERQTATLLWLSRLSKYTLVDVFSVIGVLVGVQLQLNIGGTEAVTRAEPRFGIIAFFIATVWEFLQIELIKAMHERKVVLGGHNNPDDGRDKDRLLFSNLWVPVLILAASLGLYIAGAMTEIVYFASTDLGSDGVCKKSYNLITLGNALVNDLSMTSNSAPGQTWVLYLSYVALNLVFPILTHLLQICFIVGWFRSTKLRRLIEWTLAIWLFACIEILLIGIFAVEYKFPNLIMKIAGDTNAAFLDIDSDLGTGFYLLIAYSVVAGFLQASLRIRHEKSSQPSTPEPEVAKNEDD